MHVEVVAWRSLQVALLERFTVPYTIALIHRHVVHVNRNPDISGGIRYLVIYVVVNQEIVGLDISVLNIINARLTY